ncbi:YdiU family protein [Xanthomonas sp. XNM01]|uniref:protein adenylyltransferase SelO n=1 Tax=Xanthomonas sp. XNM01 TaxID=2769289 RepID=UPI00177CFA8A|nr:YdiU family protein [Xanthomonas sp. XNM01]MBD9368181.1 YdiU family protein [Xanthomonas sp. XNM01]
MQIEFDNSALRELPGDSERGPRVREVLGAAWSAVEPTPVAAPRLLAWSPDAASLIGLDAGDAEESDFARVFGGNALLPGMAPWAANYGGHQFGNWAGQLGDGRAISLGEAIAADGRRWELQLKGAGRTPYSRFADGRAVLRSSLREFVCSEAMHHLGVPTTRALSLVGTGEAVVRDMFYDGRARPEPGAVVCRMAPSFLRFGSYELPTSRGDVALLRQLADYTIRHHYPALDLPAGPDYGEWFGQVCERTARLVAEWMRVGFVHGVMNTDNLSILGLTIDYGPYGWVEDYDPDWTPNTTDAQGRRYRFGWQSRIAGWNLTRLAQALAPLFEDVAPLQEGLERFQAAWDEAECETAARKLGLSVADAGTLALMADLHELLQDGMVDMTLFFRGLLDVDPQAPSAAPLEHAFYDPHRRAAVDARLQDWLARHAARRLADPLSPQAGRERMRLANPRYVPRNWLAQQAIDRAEQGDLAELHTLMDVLRLPYDDQPGREAYAVRRPDWALQRAGCSALSCSS